MTINSSLLESIIPACKWIADNYQQVLNENSFYIWYNNLTENDVINLELDKDAIRDALWFINETQENIDDENCAEYKYLSKIGGRVVRLSLKIHEYEAAEEDYGY